MGGYIKKIDILRQSIIIFIIIIGFFLRIYNLGDQSLWLDEAISSIAAVAFLEKGAPVLPSGISYDRALLNTFFIANSFKIFGVTEFAARLPSVLFGTLTILLTYYIGLKWGNWRIALITATLVAFSVWEIAWSRQARMYQQLQFFYLLSIFLFYEFTINKDVKLFFLMLFSVAATILSHVFGYALMIVFLVYLIISIPMDPRMVKNGKRFYMVTVLVFIVVLSFAHYIGIIPSILKTEINYYETYIFLLKNNLGIFLFLAVAGGDVMVKRDWKQGLILILALVIPLYFIFYHVLLIGTRYLYFVVPILFLMVGYFMDFMLDYLYSSSLRLQDFLKQRTLYFRWKIPDNLAFGNTIYKIPQRTIAYSIVILILSSVMYFSPAFTFTPKARYDLGVNAPQSDFKNAYFYIQENMQSDDAIVSAWTPPALFYLEKSDYWLAFNVVGTGTEKFLVNNSDREIYTNAIAIENVETFANVINNHDRGWVVIDAVAWRKIRPSVRDFMNNNLTYHLTIGDTVRVYGWGK